MYGICSKLTIKTPERLYWRRFGVFAVNFVLVNFSCSSVSTLFLLTLIFKALIQWIAWMWHEKCREYRHTHEGVMGMTLRAIYIKNLCNIVFYWDYSKHLLFSEAYWIPPQHLRWNSLWHCELMSQQQPLTNITKSPILDVRGVLDSPPI